MPIISSGKAFACILEFVYSANAAEISPVLITLNSKFWFGFGFG